jgi:hypothetical protein
VSVCDPAPANQRPNRLCVPVRRREAAAHAVQLRHDASARPQHRRTLDLLRISATPPPSDGPETRTTHSPPTAFLNTQSPFVDLLLYPALLFS